MHFSGPRSGACGATTVAGFALLLASLEGRRSLEDLSVARAALFGGAVGTLFPFVGTASKDAGPTACSRTSRPLACYVALLRGINVGGHRVKMDRLREIFEELPVSDVSTFIASGNVIFSSDAGDEAFLTGRIEAHLADRLGYEVPTFLRTPDELQDVLDFDLPAGARDDGNAVYVNFLSDRVSAEMPAAFAELESETDRFAVAEREIYWCVKGKLSDSPLFKTGIDGALGGASSTMRNLNTVRRLVAKV